MAQEPKLHRRDQKFAIEGTTESSKVFAAAETDFGSSQLRNNEKRKHRVLECDSDDDFAGFDEDADASENGVADAVYVSSKKGALTLLSTAGLPQSSGAESNFSCEMETTIGLGTSMSSNILDQNSKTTIGMVPAGQPKRKVGAPAHAQDDAFKLPFKYGWKRELVYRAHMDGGSKDKGEVYYITPSGKKLRTRNDIVMALHDDLTMDNFTFMKDPVGGSPDEEIIRSAKSYGTAPRRPTNTTPALPIVEVPAENSLGKRIPKPKMPKGASPPPPSYSRASIGQSRTPPSSRSASQQSPKSMITPLGARQTGNTTTVKTNENASIPVKLGKSKNKADDNRKAVPSSKNPAVQGNSRSSFIAADIAAIQSEPPPCNTSSTAAGMDQNRLFASNFFSNVSIGYDILQQTFQYLKVQELLRASCVCRMWNQVANHPRLWRTVRMKNSHVNDWYGFVSTLRKNGTKHLDMRKMLISGNSDEMWQKFIENIPHVEQLARIDLCRCSSTVVGSLLKSNPNLKVINALAIKNDPIDFSCFEHGRYLQELRLKSSSAISVDNDFTQLKYLSNLRHLSLTSILKLGSTSISALSELVKLESLELGECTEIGQNLSEVLQKTTRLQRLRLEKGQENFNMFAVLEGIAKHTCLQQLELINCDVKVGFDKYIHKCTSIKRLLIIPTYVSQSAATNHMVLSGIAKLKDTLETFVWAVTVELLRVTELYIDQCDTKNRDEKNNPGESIPILKPVPGVEDILVPSSANTSDTPAQVEIVPLSTVHNILNKSLPQTNIKILKIPFASTWKQGMLELAQF